MLHMPVDVRNVSLALLALFASVALLHWASAVFIPIMLSLLLTTALRPTVEALWRWHVPRWLGAGLLLVAIVSGLATTAWSLSDGAAQLVDSLPIAAKKVRDNLKNRTGASSPLDNMQKAATQIEQAANDTGASTPPRRGVQRVIIERPPFNIRDYLWSGTMGLMSALGQLMVVIFLTYFALASGNLFRDKLVRIAGTTLERRKITIHVLGDITGQIQRYLLVQVFTSVLVGLATGTAYWALGLENAAVWGVVAAVLNLAPYIGSALVTHLREDGHEVLRLVRRVASEPDEIRWVPDEGYVDRDRLDGVDAVVHLAGAGVGDDDDRPPAEDLLNLVLLRCACEDHDLAGRTDVGEGFQNLCQNTHAQPPAVGRAGFPAAVFRCRSGRTCLHGASREAFCACLF